MELYHVTTIAKKYSGCKNVEFIWFRCERRAPRPYADLIVNYDAAAYVYYPEGYIDELFELDEAQALKDYIDQNHGEETTTTIKKAELPIANTSMGAGAMPVGAAMTSRCSTGRRTIPCRSRSGAISIFAAVSLPMGRAAAAHIAEATNSTLRAWPNRSS